MLESLFDSLLLLGTNLLFIEGLMMLLWIFYLVNRNVSLIDSGWGLSFILAAATLFILGEGYFWRRLLVLTIVSIWALRLTWHLFKRFRVDQDDPRYEKLLKSPIWPGPMPVKVLVLYLIQGLLASILSLPFVLMSQNRLPFFSPGEVFGLLLWVVGVAGEALADRQLASFKQRASSNHSVFKKGLWRYSRHPNYFFEWITWISYFIMALSSPWGWLALISPVLMLYLLLKVSGIPPTEEQALETHGEAYRVYQRETSPFFPWFYKDIELQRIQ